jgi:Fe-S cluster biosynthesis and repair protein YggX
MARMVQCVKLGRELPGLERPPVGGELGQRIFDNVSAEAWQMWQRHATLLMNHYGLNMADPRTRDALKEEMEQFFFGEDARVPEGWVDPEQGGSSKGGGAPAAKGGGGARRK